MDRIDGWLHISRKREDRTPPIGQLTVHLHTHPNVFALETLSKATVAQNQKRSYAARYAAPVVTARTESSIEA